MKTNITSICRWLFSQGYEVNLLDDGWQVKRSEGSTGGCSVWTPILQEVDESVLMAFVKSKGYEYCEMPDIEVPDKATWRMATYYDMLDLWGYTADAGKRRVIGDIMLNGVAQINDHTLTVFDRSEFLILQTLSFVGTPLCECDIELQQKAIKAGLHKDQTFGVRFEAVRALNRFVDKYQLVIDKKSSLLNFDLLDCPNEEIGRIVRSLWMSKIKSEPDEVWDTTE